MSTLSNIAIGGVVCVALGFFASGLALAQDPQQQQTQNPGWRRANDPPPGQANGPSNPDPSGNGNGIQNDGPPPPPDNNADNQQNYTVPPQLTIQPGTFVTVRVNQPLSSDHNRAGDAFTATLERPIVVNGIVVAQPGQTVAGRVEEAQKAGRVEGVSRLAIQLTDLTLVDGQQMPIRSQLLNGSGSTSKGRDAGAIAGTTGLGAAAGAIGGGGLGAGIGAAAGAVVGTVGVLLTRGHATVIYPESLLTFRIQAPVTISTASAPEAFRYVEPDQYGQRYQAQGPPPPQRNYGCGPYGCPPPPSYYGYGYAYGAPYFYGPGFYGPGFYSPNVGFFFGPRFGYRGGFRGRGFRGGYRR